MSRLRCSSTESQMSSIVIPMSDPKDIMSSLSTSSMVEVGSGDGVKLDQLTVFCLFFPSAQAVKATSRGHRLCTNFGKLMLASVSWACWYSSYTDGPPMKALENSCGTAHLQGSCVTLSIVMHCTKGWGSSLSASSQLRLGICMGLATHAGSRVQVPTGTGMGQQIDTHNPLPTRH